MLKSVRAKQTRSHEVILTKLTEINRLKRTFGCVFTWDLRLTTTNINSSEFLESPAFSAAASGSVNVTWSLRLYPNCAYKDGYVSLCLRLHSVSSRLQIDADFELSVLDQHNVKSKTMKSFGSKFVAAGDMSGFQHFLKRTELIDQNGKLLVNDLRIHCIVHSGALLKDSLPSMEQRDVVVPKSSLPVDFWQLYINQKLVDVTVDVKGKKFKVHKAVLAARSPVFASMFDTNMVESNSNRVVLSDIEPEVFLELLRFMYLDKSENLDKVASDLLACAEMYALEPLKVMCEESISTNLSVEGAADVLVLADLYRLTRLKQQVFDFIKPSPTQPNQPLKITLTDGWKTLTVNHPHLVTEAFQSLAAQNGGK